MDAAEYAALSPYVAKRRAKLDRRVWAFEPLEWRVAARNVPLIARSYVVAAPRPLWRWWR